MNRFEFLTVQSLSVALILTAAITSADAVVVPANDSNASQTFYTVSATDLVNDGQPTLADEDDADYGANLVAGAPTVLNNGLLGGASDGGEGAGEEGGSFQVFYTLDTTLNPLGYNIEQIDTYSAWSVDSRSGQMFTLAYNIVGDPTFITVGTFTLNNNGSSDLSSRITLTNDTGGPLSDTFGTMTGVSELRFDLQNVGGLGQVYREIDVFGTPVADLSAIPEPSTAALIGLGTCALGASRRRRRRR